MIWATISITCALAAWVIVEHATYRGGLGPVYAAIAACVGIPVVWLMQILSWVLP